MVFDDIYEFNKLQDITEDSAHSEISRLKNELPRLQNIAHIQSILESRFKDFEFRELNGLPHPNALLNNMESARLIADKILKNECIVIVGDYDADGICATCIMLDFFEKLGYENIGFAMPHRFKHGYGFSAMLFGEIVSEYPQVSLIITVDNGVSSFEAGALCAENGIDLIITDHHTLEKESVLESRQTPYNHTESKQRHSRHDLAFGEVPKSSRHDLPLQSKGEVSKNTESTNAKLDASCYALSMTSESDCIDSKTDSKNSHFTESKKHSSHNSDSQRHSRHDLAFYDHPPRHTEPCATTPPRHTELERSESEVSKNQDSKENAIRHTEPLRIKGEVSKNTESTNAKTDSITKEKIPPCNFLVNPQQSACSFPYSDICGSLVAWYLICAIKITLQTLHKDSIESKKLDSINTQNLLQRYSQNLSKMKMEELLLLVGIAIISDVMPLNAINHTICKYALKNLRKSSKPGIIVLLEYLNHKIDSQTLGFKLIPLLNAAGRIDDGKIALAFLRAKTLQEAREHFRALKHFNIRRKQLQDEITYKAFDSLHRFKQSVHIVCAVGDGWHEGVLGIVAGKMTSDFKKPCFALTNNNGICKGSGRSFGNIDLISSMSRLAHLTNRHGGHIGAVGLEIPLSNIQEFINSFEPIFHDLQEVQHIIGVLDSRLISHELMESIEIFEPYGNANPVPKFLLELEILSYKRTNQGYIEFRFRFENRDIKGMFFNTQYANFTFKRGDVLCFSGTLALDSVFYIQSYEIMIIIDKIYGLHRA